ncbi:hypothetical protein MJO28_011468 [Puccinia striiformis f. sp. tritici]|uniref:Uncharacterized protein n=2 Tax=Puccinia striiformis TaxID=27350 RepID=A0A2S4VEE1_9BASI|nr:hypothetical protein MJO28_011468 [Puccinia striiformis f. sp. tritici]POW07911.1 hypothetical protein PSTT_07973 [Puccinia striiformis]
MESHRERGELIFQGFRRLASKCDIRRESRYPESDEETSYVPQVGMRKGRKLLNQLKSNLVPLLQEQLGILSRALRPDLSDSQEEDEFLDSNLELILEIQPQLEQNIDRIKSAFYILCPEVSNSVVDQAYDSHYKDIKYARLDGINNLLSDRVFPKMVTIFEESCKIIQRLGLSLERCNEPINIDSTRKRLAMYTSSNRYSLESVISCINGSELDNCQDTWSIEFSSIDEHLSDFSRWTNNLTIDQEEERDRSSRINEQVSSSALSEPAIKLAKSLIPITKLSRTFFRKLSQRGMNQKKLPKFTKMCSEQIDSLAQSASNVQMDLVELKQILIDETSIENFPSNLIIETVNTIKTHLESALFLILLYYVPVIPSDDDLDDNDEDDDDLKLVVPVHNKEYFQDWFILWFTTFNLSLQNFIEIVRSIEANHPNP